MFRPMTNMYIEASTEPNRNLNGRNTHTTTPKSIRSSTTNSFWNEWSATQPTHLDHNEIDRHSMHMHTHEMPQQTTPIAITRTTTPKRSSEMAPWMEDVLNELSTTTTPRSHLNSNSNMNDQNRENGHTTNRKPKENAEMLPWMQEVLHEYSTTTRKSIQLENDRTKQTTFGGGGDSDRSNHINSDLHMPNPNRYYSM